MAANNKGCDAYLNSYYEGMSPNRLILALYEGALKHIRLAKEGVIEKDPKKRGENLSCAIAIVSELNSCLDSNIRDDSIEFLRGFYISIMTELPKVLLNNDVKILDQTFSYINRLKDIWKNNVMGEKAENENVKQLSDKKKADKKKEKELQQQHPVSYGKVGGYNLPAMAMGGTRSFLA